MLHFRQDYLRAHDKSELEKRFWRPYGAITLYEAKDLSGIYVMTRRLPKGGVLQLCVGTEIADFKADLVHKRYHAFNLKRNKQGDYVFFDPNKGHIFLCKNANKAAARLNMLLLRYTFAGSNQEKPFAFIDKPLGIMVSPRQLNDVPHSKDMPTLCLRPQPEKAIDLTIQPHNLS